tara:strand:+ start:1619 stop:2035 length:417 start_codon:yes stop_codon:yes gene_type:complete
MQERDESALVLNLSLRLSDKLSDLHYLLAGQAEELQGNTELNARRVLKSIREIMDDESLPLESRDLLKLLVVQASVMNEKFPIASWNNDAEIALILDSIQSERQDLAEQFRCLDWTTVQSYMDRVTIDCKGQVLERAP